MPLNLLSITNYLFYSGEIRAEPGSQYGYITYQGDDPINRLEVLDQHNGTGGFVYDVAWLDENTGVYVAISGSPIHFIVNIFGERVSPGNPIDYSAVAHKHHIVEPQVTLN